MWPLIATVAASVIGGALSSKASKSAAKTEAAASDRAAELQNQQFEKLLALQMPGYNRANAAGDLYSRALGIGRPQRTAPTAQNYAQPSMTGGGYQGGYTGGYASSPYPQQQMVTDDGGSQDLGVNPQARLMTGGGSYTSGQANVPAPQQIAEGGQGGDVYGGDQLDIAGQVMGTPGYQYQLDQGLKAIDRAAPLRGGMYSGRRMKALEAQGQNTFGAYYQNWMDRVGGVAGQAPVIAQNIGEAGQANANNVSTLLMTGANARANGTRNSAAAWNGALGTAAGMAGGYFG